MSPLADWWSLTDAPPPAAAVEIAADHVAAASVESRGGRPVVAAHAAEPLPDGAVAPSLTAVNVKDKAAVGAALGRVLEAVGRPRRVGLVIPDPVAKVSLIRFEHVPSKAQELDQLIRWQVRKAAPFPIDEAQVSYIRGLHASDGQEFVVTLARRDVVLEYEALCSACGAHAGVVDVSTFNVINTALAAAVPPSADWLLVNVASHYASIAILRGADLMFFRSRGSDGEGTLADLVHQTAMYYEDRLQGVGFSRVMLSGASAQTADVEHIRRSLQERLGRTVETVDAGAAAAFTDRIAAAPAFLDTIAPLVGLLVRGREAAHA
jgi:Tfp pilus assembly PilM family ATPase